MRIIVALCLLLSTGCTQHKVESQVKELLRDPQSARFGEITISKDGLVACGTVNAKNGMGGYAGEQTFMVYHGTAQMTGPMEQWMDLADCCFEALARSNGRAPVPERGAACRRLSPAVQLAEAPSG